MKTGEGKNSWSDPYFWAFKCFTCGRKGTRDFWPSNSVERERWIKHGSSCEGLRNYIVVCRWNGPCTARYFANRAVIEAEDFTAGTIVQTGEAIAPSAIEPPQAEERPADTVMLTGPERALMRKVYAHIAPCIASTEYGIESIKRGHASGGGGGFSYRCKKNRIIGQWHQWTLVERYPNGEPKRWNQGRLLQEVSISYTRLAKWCDSLPESIRAQAVTWWRTYPVDTRDLPALYRLTLEQLADPEEPQLALW
ncbi:hypothetical protein [Nocardia sp. NBC_01388]|uniref:hypothetical protein n=1 Tax=Nocardia sp. NBC_01388 TaxID=2903596 RepID=UPI00324D839A